MAKHEYYSEYFNTSFMMSDTELHYLIDIYFDVCQMLSIEPETYYEEICNGDNSESLDEVLYHVERYGRDYPNFQYIEPLFERIID